MWGHRRDLTLYWQAHVTSQERAHRSRLPLFLVRKVEEVWGQGGRVRVKPVHEGGLERYHALRFAQTRSESQFFFLMNRRPTRSTLFPHTPRTPFFPPAA